MRDDIGPDDCPFCRSSVDPDAFQRNVEAVAEGVAQYIYNLSTLGHQFQGRLFSGETVQ